MIYLCDVICVTMILYFAERASMAPTIFPFSYGDLLEHFDFILRVNEYFCEVILSARTLLPTLPHTHVSLDPHFTCCVDCVQMSAFNWRHPPEMESMCKLLSSTKSKAEPAKCAGPCVCERVEDETARIRDFKWIK